MIVKLISIATRLQIIRKGTLPRPIVEIYYAPGTGVYIVDFALHGVEKVAIPWDEKMTYQEIIELAAAKANVKL